jgi:predicted nucleic-acid-binding Zn-ribbon protein
MKTSGRCPKCMGTDIVANARVIDRRHFNIEDNLEVVTYENPEALIFKGKQGATVKAWVCRTCGLTELYCVALE